MNNKFVTKRCQKLKKMYSLCMSLCQGELLLNMNVQNRAKHDLIINNSWHGKKNHSLKQWILRKILLNCSIAEGAAGLTPLLLNRHQWNKIRNLVRMPKLRDTFSSECMPGHEHSCLLSLKQFHLRIFANCRVRMPSWAVTLCQMIVWQLLLIRWRCGSFRANPAQGNRNTKFMM